MSLFDRLQGQRSPQITPQMNFQQALQQLRADPVKTLKQQGLSIPEGMTNPQAMVQHLVTSGQVPQSRYMRAMQMMGRR